MHPFLPNEVASVSPTPHFNLDFPRTAFSHLWPGTHYEETSGLHQPGLSHDFATYELCELGQFPHLLELQFLNRYS